MPNSKFQIPNSFLTRRAVVGAQKRLRLTEHLRDVHPVSHECLTDLELGIRNWEFRKGVWAIPNSKFQIPNSFLTGRAVVGAQKRLRLTEHLRDVHPFAHGAERYL